MKSIFKIFFALAISAVCISPLAQAQTAEEFFMLGNNAYKAADYKKAVENYDRAAKAGLDTSELYFNKANANVKNGEVGEALHDYLKSLSISPRMRESLANLKTFANDASLAIPEFSSVFYELSKAEWATIGIAAFWSCILIFLIPPLYGKSSKLTFFLGIVFICAFVVAAFGVKNWLDFEANAVAVKPDSPLRISPAPNAPIDLRASEGQIARVYKTHGNYFFVKMSNGKTGWVDKKDFQLIAE